MGCKMDSIRLIMRLFFQQLFFDLSCNNENENVSEN